MRWQKRAFQVGVGDHGKTILTFVCTRELTCWTRFILFRNEYTKTRTPRARCERRQRGVQLSFGLDDQPGGAVSLTWA